MHFAPLPVCVARRPRCSPLTGLASRHQHQLLSPPLAVSAVPHQRHSPYKQLVAFRCQDVHSTTSATTALSGLGLHSFCWVALFYLQIGHFFQTGDQLWVSRSVSSWIRNFLLDPVQYRTYQSPPIRIRSEFLL